MMHFLGYIQLTHVKIRAKFLQKRWIVERRLFRAPKSLVYRSSSQERRTNLSEGIRGKIPPSFPTCAWARVFTEVKVAEQTTWKLEVVEEAIGKVVVIEENY